MLNKETHIAILKLFFTKIFISSHPIVLLIYFCVSMNKLQRHIQQIFL
nr:MAG TPA_asm: hypothetical protein [Caudoviricetes sp.]